MARYLVLKRNYGHITPTTLCEEGEVVNVVEDKKLPEKLFQRIDSTPKSQAQETQPTPLKTRNDMIFEAKALGLTKLGLLNNDELARILVAKTPEEQEAIYSEAKKRIEGRKAK